MPHNVGVKNVLENMKEVLALYKNVIGCYRPLLDGERYLTDREVASNATNKANNNEPKDFLSKSISTVAPPVLKNRSTTKSISISVRSIIPTWTCIA